MTQTEVPTPVVEEVPEQRRSLLDKLFELRARQSTAGREVRGGATTVVAMAYIVLLNPLILGASADITGARLSAAPVTPATALAAAVMTVLMGLVGTAPLALAAGLGINGIVAFQMAPEMTWPQAFGLVVLEGVCIVLMAVSGVRERIMNAIPRPLKMAITVGIGLYIALVGLVSAGFVTRMPDAAQTTVPVRLGASGHLHGWPIVVVCFGLLLMVVLMARKVPGAVLISIGVATVFAVVLHEGFGVGGWGLTSPALPDHVVAAPDFGLFGHIDLFGGFASAGGVPGPGVLFNLVLSGVFHPIGTVHHVSHEGGVSEDGQGPRMGRILLVDGAG